MTTLFPIVRDGDWFLPVGDDGTANGLVCEGAFGFVLQLRDVDGGRKALKLPRLIADTQAENAYLVELLFREEFHVRLVDGRSAQRGSLLGSLNLSREGPLRIESQRLRSGFDGTQSLVAVQFRPNRNPRFCRITRDPAGDFDVFPKAASDCPVMAHWDAVLRMLEEPAPRVPVVTLPERNGVADADTVPRALSDSLHDSLTDGRWYVGLPSILFDWADGNLQEALVRRASFRGTRDWETEKHLRLAARVLDGVKILHGAGLIHGDIRPSNVMFSGFAHDPDGYVLADYGSLASRMESSPKIGSTVILGTDLGRDRVSPFYPPERRGGLELESWQISFLHRRADGRYVILLGWPSDLTGDGQEVQPWVRTELEAPFEPGTDPALDVQREGDAILSGDRLQLREYLFEIEATRFREDRQIFLCRPACWRVRHGRTAIVDEHPIPSGATGEPFVLPIPRAVVYQQWSAATDLYGVGALLLYALLRGDASYESSAQALADSDFTLMIRSLESNAWFEVVFPDLHELVACLDDAFDYENKRTAGSVRHLTLIHEIENGHGGYHGKTLAAAAADLSRLLCRTAPHMEKVLGACRNNSVRFLGVVHLALCCLHRRTSLPRAMRTTSIHLTEAPVSDRSAFEAMPFCEHRRTPVGDSGEVMAAAAAVRRVRRLEILLGDRMFTGFDAVPTRYDPGMDHDLRRAQARDRKRLQVLRDEYRKLLDSLSNYVEANDDLRSQRGLSRIVGRDRETLRRLEAAMKQLTDALRQSPSPKRSRTDEASG